MRSSLKTFFTLIVLCLFFPASLFADGLPQPQTAYSADYRFSDIVNATEGRFFYSGGIIRMETVYEGEDYVLIVKIETNTFQVLMPSQKFYGDMHPDEANAVFGYLRPYSDMKHSVVGEETAGGEKAVKRKYPVGCPDCTVEGFTWHTPDGIMVKMVEIVRAMGDRSKAVFELENIKRGKLDPALFEVPDDYELPDEQQAPDDMNEIEIMESG